MAEQTIIVNHWVQYFKQANQMLCKLNFNKGILEKKTELWLASVLWYGSSLSKNIFLQGYQQNIKQYLDDKNVLQKSFLPTLSEENIFKGSIDKFDSE